jgi:hypothetical protein
LGQILSISIYIQWGNQHEVPFGKRAIVYRGLADLETILQEEATGKYIKRVQEESMEREDMLVMGEILRTTRVKLLTNLVSVCDPLRDRLRDLIRGYLDNKIRLWELEYQPA